MRPKNDKNLKRKLQRKHNKHTQTESNDDIESESFKHIVSIDQFESDQQRNRK